MLHVAQSDSDPENLTPGGKLTLFVTFAWYCIANRQCPAWEPVSLRCAIAIGTVLEGEMGSVTNFNCQQFNVVTDLSRLFPKVSSMTCCLVTFGESTFTGVSVLFQVVALPTVALIGAIDVGTLLATGFFVTFINI